METDPGIRAYARDALLAAGVAALAIGYALLGPTPVTALAYALLAAGSLVLAARRRAPRTVLLLSFVCVLGYGAAAEPGLMTTVPLLVALYTVVSAGHRVLALTVVVPLVSAVVAGNLGRSLPDEPLTQAFQDAVLPVGWFVVAFVLGEVNRHRDAYLRQVEARAIEAERTREETALRRADEERLRIARELHDSLTHCISVIKVQAGVAVHLARKRGEDVPEALLAVQEASGEAMRELRATLEVLRDADGDAPPTGLERLPGLVERASAAGVPATLTVDGPPRALPVEVDRAAYRIVQESLTNVARHAGPATASVRIRFEESGISVRVDDDGAAVPERSPVPGVGLLGMSERVTALGGRLCAEPRPEGGFSVRAEIPLEAHA